MTITHTKGATVFTDDSIDYFALVTQKHAVGLEKLGIRVRRGPLVWKRLRDHYQVPGTGSRKATIEQVHAWLTAKVEELATQQKHAVEE